MKLKVGDKVKLRRDRPKQTKNHWNIPENSWKENKESVISSVHSKGFRIGGTVQDGIRLKSLAGNPESFIWPIRYFDKVDGIRINQNPIGKLATWNYPVTWFEVDEQKKETKVIKKTKKLKNKFKVGDFVKLSKNSGWQGKIVSRKNIKDRPYANYEVKFDGRGPTKRYAKVTHWYNAKVLSKMTDAEIILSKIKAAKPNPKNKFKVGDAVKLSTFPKWTGSVIERRNNKSNNWHGNYSIRWNKTSPSKSDDTWQAPGNLTKLSVEEMREIAQGNKKADFKIGQRATIVHRGLTGTGKEVIIKSVGGMIITASYLVCGKEASWYNPSSLYIHENTSVSVTDAAEKKKISLERKKKEKMNFKSFTKKKEKKKVARKASKPFKRDGGYVVRALIENGAASKAGIRVGDTIINVDGRRVYYKSGLGGILKSFKKGATVSVTVKRPDGREVFIRKVKLGGRADGRATLGVISGKRSASTYNHKVEGKAKKMAKGVDAITKEVLSAVPENEFMKRARVEMEDVGSLMADMKGRDALLKVRDLKRKLHSELRSGMSENTKLVNSYLEGLRSAGKEEIDTEGKRTLSIKGKIVFTLIGIAAVLGGVAASLIGLGLL